MDGETLALKINKNCCITEDVEHKKKLHSIWDGFERLFFLATTQT